MKTIMCKIKKKFIYILTALIVTTFSQCHNPVSNRKNDLATVNNKTIGAQQVSLISLIANPEKYDGKPIILIGFLSLGFESKVLFLNKEDCDAGLGLNGIWVEISDSEHYRDNNKQYVIIEGVFDSGNKGHLGGYIGAIDKITRVVNLHHPVKTLPHSGASMQRRGL